MRVRMTKHITGYRNGVEWPEVGGVIDVPDHEAHDLIGNRYAEPAGEDVAPESVDLHSLKVPALKDLAKERGVDLGDATKKDDIIAVLELAAEADATPAGDT